MRKAICVLLVAYVHAQVVAGGHIPSGGVTGFGGGAASVVSITLSPTGATQQVNSSLGFSARATLSNGLTAGVTKLATWVTTNSAIATVGTMTNTQAINCVSAGTVVVIAAYGTVSGSTSLTCIGAPPPPPILASIAVSPSNTAISVGAVQGFTATGTFSDGSTQDVTATAAWASSAPAVASKGSLSARQNFTCLTGGTTTISAAIGAINNGVTLTCNAVLTSITVTPASPQTNVGTAQNFISTCSYSDGSSADCTIQATWSSGTPLNATLGAKADPQPVNCILAGTSVITATVGIVSGSQTLTCNPGGQAPPTLVSLAISPSNPTVNVGSTIGLIATCTFSDSSTRDCTISQGFTNTGWTSGTPSHVTLASPVVDPETATCIAAGTSLITAASGIVSGNTTVTCQAPAPTLVSIAVTPLTPTQFVGSGVGFTATCTYSDSSTQNCTGTSAWTSSATSVATVGAASNPQNVNCVSAGSSTVKAQISAINGTTSLTCQNISSTCGPPGYACSRTDLAITQNPAVPPKVGPNNCTAGSLAACGNLTQLSPGVSTVVRDAAYATSLLPSGPRISRITYRGFAGGNTSLEVRDNAEASEFNINSTALFVEDASSGSHYPTLFNPTTMLATRMYPGMAGGGVNISDTHLNWSGWNPGWIYSLRTSAAPPLIMKYDYSDQFATPLPTAPAPTVFYNWSTSANCLSSTYKANWNVFGTKTVAAGSVDTVFAAAFGTNNSGTANVVNGSTTVTWASGPKFDKRYAGQPITLGVTNYTIQSVAAGGLTLTLTATYTGSTQNGIAFNEIGNQGAGVDLVIYTVGKGCTYLNTETGVVKSDWGFNGTITGIDLVSMHSITLSPLGDWAIYGGGLCFQPATGQTTCHQHHFWNIGTGTITVCATGLCDSGHAAMGQAHWIQNGEGYIGQFESRLLTNPTSSFNNIFPSQNGYFPQGLQAPWDVHISWNCDTSGADTCFPIVSSIQSPPTATTEPAGNFVANGYFEIFSIDPSLTGKVHRFGHNLTIFGGSRFTVSQGLLQASPDGRFAAFSSNWLGTLGSENGSLACNLLGANGTTICRGDVFVIELQ